MIPPARSRLQGQEQSAKILVQIWASSNLSVTPMLKSGYIMGIIALLLEIHRQEVYKALRRTGLMTIPTSR